MKIILINQARMTSTRLPGKVLRKVLGKPLLEYQIERLRRVHNIAGQIVATTTNSADDPIANLCQKLGIDCYRGSESDVLSRYYEAALKYKPDAVIRVTSDCPLIDPELIDQVIKFYLQNPQFQYVSNVETRTYPRGMDTEIFSFEALENAYHFAKEAMEREHVTPYIRAHASQRGSITGSKDYSKYRWTVDTPEDFELVQKILSAIYPQNEKFLLADLVQLVQKHPEWSQINEKVRQKEE